MTPSHSTAGSTSMTFGGLEICYDDRVLAPRAWTQWQARWAAELARTAPAGPILELCTGAGQIGLLAAAESDRDLVAVDLSVHACELASRNAEAAGLAARVEVRNLPLESACRPEEVFPIIIADPPWVPSAEIERFPEDPTSAIDGGIDGLDLARACLDVIGAHLHRDGVALLQVGGADQVECLRVSAGGRLQVAEVREEPGRGAVVQLTRTA